MSQQGGRAILDETAVGPVDASQPRIGVHGAAQELARSSAAVARLTVLSAGRRLDEHIHDNPYLSLHLLGAYTEHGDAGEAAIDCPAAAFHPAGSAHADAIGAAGLATVVIEFDPAWLRRAVAGHSRLDRSRYWIGGRVGRRAGRLARAWLRGAPPAARFEATRAFLAAAAHETHEVGGPPWLERLRDLTGEVSPAPRTAELARAMGVSGAWMARAYREWRGEGLGEALRRRRVEAAAHLLEATDRPLAQIAYEVGFCDQSHMNRAFNALIGRTPGAVRANRLGLSAAT
jgi:AraC family transcriptional regulator